MEKYGQIMARVEMPLNFYKEIKEKYDMRLLKIYNPSHKEYYSKNKKWLKNNEKLKKIMSKKENLESKIRVENKL